MINRFFILLFIFLAANGYSQRNTVNGLIVLETNDSIYGKIPAKKYFSSSGVSIVNGSVYTRYPRNIVREFFVDSLHYVKTEVDVSAKVFMLKETTGPVNLYRYKKRLFLGKHNNDLTSGRIKAFVSFYCSDYPDVADSLKFLTRKNVPDFITRYNDWKLQHKGSLSFYEANKNHTPPISFKISLFVPGIGLEVKMSENLSLNTLIKMDYFFGNSVNTGLSPFADAQFRYYHNIGKRKQLGKRTYRFAGNYFALANQYHFRQQSNIAGLMYGWQRVRNKSWYSDFGLGAGVSTNGKDVFPILLKLEFGFVL